MVRLADESDAVSYTHLKGAFGDIKVRAGCLIPVFLDVKDMQLKNYLLVESVTHKIDEGIHTMDLALRGAGING